MTIGAKIGIGRTAEVFEWGNNQVIKLYYADFPADAIQREADVARLVYQAGIKTPEVNDIVDFDGRTGIIYERLHGVTLLEYMRTNPWRVRSIAKQMATLHVALHQITGHEIPSQYEKFKYLMQQHYDGDDQVRLLDYLDRLPNDNTVCHGDFHPDNIIRTESGLIIIDWMTGTQGSALSDVARTSLMLTIGDPPDASVLMQLLIRMFRGQLHQTYLTHYCRLSGVSPSEIDRWLPIVAVARMAEGLPGEESYLKALIARVINP